MYFIAKVLYNVLVFINHYLPFLLHDTNLESIIQSNLWRFSTCNLQKNSVQFIESNHEMVNEVRHNIQFKSTCINCTMVPGKMG